MGAIDHAESKSGLVFELGLLLHCDFGFFCQKLKKQEKLVGHILSQIHPWCEP